MESSLLTIIGYGLMAFFVFFIVYGIIGYAKQVFEANRR